MKLILLLSILISCNSYAKKPDTFFVKITDSAGVSLSGVYVSFFDSDQPFMRFRNPAMPTDENGVIWFVRSDEVDGAYVNELRFKDAKLHFPLEATDDTLVLVVHDIVWDKRMVNFNDKKQMAEILECQCPPENYGKLPSKRAYGSENDTLIFTTVERVPNYEYGRNCLYQHFAKSLYPKLKNKTIEPFDEVLVLFEVDTNGKAVNPILPKKLPKATKRAFVEAINSLGPFSAHISGYNAYGSKHKVVIKCWRTPKWPEH